MRKVLYSKASEGPLVTTVEADKPLKVGVVFLIIATSLVLIIAIVTLSNIISNNKNPIVAPWNDQETLYLREKRQSTRNAETTQTINSLGNFEANPCEDFYEFACGNFLKVAPLPPPPRKTFWDTFSWVAARIKPRLHTLLMSNEYEASSAVRKTKEYYQSCVKPPSSDYGALLEVIKELGGWPLMDSNWDEEAWSLQKYLLVAMKYLSSPLFNIQMIFRVGLPVITISETELTLQDPDETLAPEAFQQAVYSTMQKLLGVDERRGEEMSEEVKEQISEMWSFENHLREIMENPGHDDDPEKILSQIEHIFTPWLDLKSFMAAHFNSSIKPTDEMLFYNSYYFENLAAVISNYSKKADFRVLANYVVWTVVRDITTSISIQFESAEKILKRLEKKETSQSDGDKRVPVPRWRICVHEIKDMFEDTIGHSYIKRHIEPSHKKEVEDMCESLIEVAKKHQPDFFDKETMKRKIEKLSKTKCDIGYPPFVMNITILDQLYDKYQGGNNYLSNYIQYRLFLTHFYSTQYGRKLDSQYWPGSLLKVRALLSPPLNRVRLYAGILQSPFFHPQFSPEVSFGSIGFILGHELTHAFLQDGSKYDGEGNKVEWYTDATKKAFVPVKECYVQHYEKLEHFNRTIDGRMTLEENMADSGGLWLAFQKLLEIYGGGERGWRKLRIPTDLAGGKLNRGQLFYVAYAQAWCSFYHEKISGLVFRLSHTFNNIRMQGTLQNSREFSRVFNCPSNSTLNPSPKCHIYAP